MKIIEIIIDTFGNSTVQTKGFAGSSCRQASKAIEQALGIVQSDAVTAEMYQTANTNQQVQQGNK